MVEGKEGGREGCKRPSFLFSLSLLSERKRRTRGTRSKVGELSNTDAKGKGRLEEYNKGSRKVGQ